MERVANIVFDPTHALHGAPDRLEGRDHALRIFAQQRALAKATCKIIRMQTGALWEAMQLTFSMHAAKTDEDEIHSGSMISRDTEGKKACISLKTEAPWKCPPPDVFPRWRKSGVCSDALFTFFAAPRRVFIA
jgi:hypothetical protein